MKFPRRPNYNALYGSEREYTWGHFEFTPAPTSGNPENIKIDFMWEMENIIGVTIPQLKGVPGFPKTLTIPFHRDAADQLQEFFAYLEKDKLLDRILSWDGSFCPRFIRGSTSTLSNHAWGTAFDINAQWNWLGDEPAKFGEKGCVWELVPYANLCGFFWGGHYQDRKDGMHFECSVNLNMDGVV